jgi:hypothetical protein
MYDPVHNEEVNTSLAGMSGKIDSYTIIHSTRVIIPLNQFNSLILIQVLDNIRPLIPSNVVKCTYRSPVDSIRSNQGANKIPMLSTQSFNL